MATKTLISFFDKQNTPDFEGRVEYQNPKLFKGKVPGYSDYVIADDPSIVEVFVNKGVEDYAKIQSNKSVGFPSESGHEGSASGKPEFGPVDSESESHEPTEHSERTERESDQGTADSPELNSDEFWSLNFFKQKALVKNKLDVDVKNKEEMKQVLSE